MFIDASAIVAILLHEPGYEELEKVLAAAPTPALYISPLVKFEVAQALAKQKAPRGRKPSAELLMEAVIAVTAFVNDLEIEEMPISSEIGDAALAASMRYGKSIGHPADLNFGDCYAYACAKKLGVKLLYKGNDFAQTDLG